VQPTSLTKGRSRRASEETCAKVLAAVVTRPFLTRYELIQTTDLSHDAANKAVAALRTKHWIVEGPTKPNGRGRRAAKTLVATPSGRGRVPYLAHYASCASGDYDLLPDILRISWRDYMSGPKFGRLLDDPPHRTLPPELVLEANTWFSRVFEEVYGKLLPGCHRREGGPPPSLRSIRVQWGGGPFSRLRWKSGSPGTERAGDGKPMTIGASVLHIEDVARDMDAHVIVTLVKGWDAQLEHFVQSYFEWVRQRTRINPGLVILCTTPQNVGDWATALGRLGQRFLEKHGLVGTPAAKALTDRFMIYADAYDDALTEPLTYRFRIFPLPDRRNILAALQARGMEWCEYRPYEVMSKSPEKDIASAPRDSG